MSTTEHLTAAETAKRLGISLRTVRRRIADGTLPTVRIGGAVRVLYGDPALIIDPEPAAHGTGIAETVAPYSSRARAPGLWPYTRPALLADRSRAFDVLTRVRISAGSASAVTDTLEESREEFGARGLPSSSR
jgi:excisionase family DNA binding protein